MNRRHTEVLPGHDHFRDRLGNENAIDNLTGKLSNQTFSPPIVNALRATCHDLLAGSIRQQAVHPSVQIDNHRIIILQTVDLGEFNHHAIVNFIKYCLVLEYIFHPVWPAKPDNATHCPVYLVIYTRSAIRVREVVGAHFSIEIQTPG